MIPNDSKILAIVASPRRDGSCAKLAERFVEKARSREQTVSTIWTSELKIAACDGCLKCISSSCPKSDDFTVLQNALDVAELIAVFTPVYFYGVPAHFKAAIDRSNAAYYDNMGKNLSKLATFFAIGDSKGERFCEGVRLTLKYFLLAQQFKLIMPECVPDFAHCFSNNQEDFWHKFDNWANSFLTQTFDQCMSSKTI